MSRASSINSRYNRSNKLIWLEAEDQMKARHKGKTLREVYFLLKQPTPKDL